MKNGFSPTTIEGCWPCCVTTTAPTSVGCDLCEAACPSRVITVVSAEVPDEPTKRYAKAYSMDMTRCVFCGLCLQVCPVDDLSRSKDS